MEKFRKIINKTFAALAIVGVWVAIGTVDDSTNELAMRLFGLAAFGLGTAVWLLTGDGKEAAQ